MDKNVKENISSFVPAEYKEKMFLTVSDVKDIMQMGQTLCYEYLNSDVPFTVIKINSKILINAFSFWTWYFE